MRSRICYSHPRQHQPLPKLHPYNLPACTSPWSSRLTTHQSHLPFPWAPQKVTSPLCSQSTHPRVHDRDQSIRVHIRFDCIFIMLCTLWFTSLPPGHSLAEDYISNRTYVKDEPATLQVGLTMVWSSIFFREGLSIMLPGCYPKFKWQICQKQDKFHAQRIKAWKWTQDQWSMFSRSNTMFLVISDRPAIDIVVGKVLVDSM